MKMKLANGYDLMDYAKRNGYILPAFNTINMEMTYAIAKGLNDAQLPGYLQISTNNLRLSNPKIIAQVAQDAADRYDIPIGLHLDHGKTFESVKDCCDAGFTSIMIDNSALPFEENIKETRRAAEYCHFYGVPVEAELGAISGKEDDIVSEADAHTNPDQVVDFVERTGCDLLAVAVGNVHGLDVEPKVDLDLLKKIADISPVPIVLHGGSGIPFETIQKARQCGLLKINYGSDLRKEFIATFGRAYEQNHNLFNVIELSLQSVENVAAVAKNLVTIINS